MCFDIYGPLRRSCVFLANYVPKCQMSSGPYGPILHHRSKKCNLQWKLVTVAPYHAVKISIFNTIGLKGAETE